MEILKVNVQSQSSSLIDYISNTRNKNYKKEFLLWQYSDPKSNIYIVEDQNQICGTQGMIPFSLRFKKQLFLTHKSETTYVSDQLRGTGLFENLYARSTENAIKDGAGIIWGFTALGNLWEKKLGFKCDRDLISESNLIIGFRGIKISKKLFYYIVKSIIIFIKLLLSSKPRMKFDEQDLNDLREFEKFSLHSNFTNYVGVDFSSKELKNRIINSPVINYKTLKVKIGDNLEGLVLFHIKNNELLISEFFYESDKNLSDVLKTIYQFAIKRRVTNIRFWANSKNSYYKKIFEKMELFGGKTNSMNDMQFVYKINKDSIIDLPLSEYLINGLWTEGFNY
jgi:hypothetical protein